MNSKSSTFDVCRAIPLHQPNEDGTTVSVYHFSHEFVAIAIDNSQYAELSATTLSQGSGTNRNKLCRKGFSSKTDETLLCLTSLFYGYSIPALRNCLVNSVLLPEAPPQSSYLADGVYHVMSHTARLQVKNDTDGLHVPISTLQCQACLIQLSCSSTLTFIQGDLVFTPDMDFCETRPEPFVASVKLTTSLTAALLSTSCQRRFGRVFIWRHPQRDCFLCTLGAGSFTPRDNDDQRGRSHSVPPNFTLLLHNFSFHQPCISRLHANADCLLTGM